MWAKILLGVLFLGMIGSAIYFDPIRERALLGTRMTDGPRLRLMTWNIGYADLEHDSRAHTEDLDSVARVILRHNPDAVALQELADGQQLGLLLSLLNNNYIGVVSKRGSADRFDAVLVKDFSARFDDVPCGDRYAVASAFSFRDDLPGIVLVSAHADAFNAAKRRSFSGEVVDWAHSRPGNEIVFIAGDFNFEVSSKNESGLFTDNQKNDSEAYSYVLKYYHDLGREAGWTAINERRIDYIFGPPERVLLRWSEVIKGAAAGRMDHLPLLIEVVF